MIEELKEGSLNRWMCKFCFRNFFICRDVERWGRGEMGSLHLLENERRGLKGKREVCLICR